MFFRPHYYTGGCVVSTFLRFSKRGTCKHNYSQASVDYQIVPFIIGAGVLYLNQEPGGEWDLFFKGLRFSNF